MLNLVRVVIDNVKDGIFTAAGYVGQVVTGAYLQHYGFISRPKKGAKGVALTLPNGAYLIASKDLSVKVDVEEGEVCLYTSPDVKIHLKGDNSIEITGAKVLIKSSVVELGEGTTEKSLKAETFMQLFNTHTHACTAPGNQSAPPTAPMTELHLSQGVKNG